MNLKPMISDFAAIGMVTIGEPGLDLHPERRARTTSAADLSVSEVRDSADIHSRDGTAPGRDEGRERIGRTLCGPELGRSWRHWTGKESHGHAGEKARSLRLPVAAHSVVRLLPR
jgi:hypothetical protein